MQDLIFVAIVVAFFALAAGFVRLCDRMITGDGVPVPEAEAPPADPPTSETDALEAVR